jgi:DNA-directed RNA polymerase alpha subunit
MGDPVPVPEPDQQRSTETSELPDELYNLSIEDLKLSARTSNCLRRGNINTVGEVLERSDTELLALRNFGERSLKELKEHLAQIGAVQNSDDADDTNTTRTILTSYSTTGEENDSEIEAVRPSTGGRTFLPD